MEDLPGAGRPPANTPETLGVTPRYVLQMNAISRSAHGLSATARKLAAMAMSLIPPDMSSLTAAFTFTGFCKALGYSDGGKEYKIFKAAVDECLKSVITIETDPDKNGKKRWRKFTWFTEAQYDEKSGAATMTFSPKFAAVLLELKRVYAKINLLDLGGLQSRYAIRIFELAVSYMSMKGKQGNPDNAWYFQWDIKELRKILGVPQNAYKETQLFKRYALEKPIEEINSAGFGIKINLMGIKQGRFLVAVRFGCEQVPRTAPTRRGRRKRAGEASRLTLPETDRGTAEERFEKEKQRLKELYPAEFEKYYKEGLSIVPPWAPESLGQISAESYALEKLKEKRGIVK